jgi:hypothetical protein
MEKSRTRLSGKTYVKPKDLLNGLERVREAARKDSQIRFTSLFHHLTVELLRESYGKLNPKAAPGVDEVTWAEYGKGLEGRIADLHDRLHNDRYLAKPSKRIYIPKEDVMGDNPITSCQIKNKTM